MMETLVGGWKKATKIHFVCLHQIPKIILSHIILNSFVCVAIDDYKSLLRQLNHFDLGGCINEHNCIEIGDFYHKLEIIKKYSS